MVGRNKLKRMDFNEDDEEDYLGGNKFLKKRRRNKVKWKNRRPKKSMKSFKY